MPGLGDRAVERAPVVDSTFALRVSPYPNDRLGGYYLAAASGIVATPGALAEIFQLRNPSATLVVIDRLHVEVAIAAAITAAQELSWDVIRSTAWTADGTGGTALTPLKRRSSYPVSVMTSANCRIATTAALGTGTKTLDASPLISGPGPQGIAIGTAGPILAGAEPTPDMEPIVALAQNEGISIRNLIAWATGSARFHVLVRWREISATVQP